MNSKPQISSASQASPASTDSSVPTTSNHIPPTIHEWQKLVRVLHDSPGQLVLAVAGAGHSALAQLLEIAGASRTLLEALFPYSAAALDDFLAGKPEQYVSSTTARLMAGRAYTRARQLRTANGTHIDNDVIGVGCTATIATDRAKKGKHRAHVALQTGKSLTEFYLELTKGKRSRQEEETLVGQLILNTIAEGFGIDKQLPMSLTEGDQLHVERVAYHTLAETLIAGESHFFGIQADGATTTAIPPVIFSGAFNPLHGGHLEMAQAAMRMLNAAVTFELAAVNVDKPPLSAAEILNRMGQFAGRAPVYASDAPTYLGKAKLYPGATFVVGYDTAIRIFAPRYYDNSESQMYTAIRTIRDLGCRFLVAGRVDEQDIFRSLADIDIPAEFQTLFTAIPERIFRRDISSTELRANNAQGSR